MKIRLEETTMLIVPETDFEVEYLRRYQSGVDGFLKTGIDLTHVVGLKIFPGEKAEEDVSNFNYAKDLAKNIWCKHYKKESPKFELCDNMLGVLSQIYNMSTGLERKRQNGCAQDEECPVHRKFD